MTKQMRVTDALDEVASNSCQALGGGFEWRPACGRAWPILPTSSSIA